MEQSEHHELPAEEGGGRLNWLLGALVLITAVVAAVVLAAGVQSSRLTAPPVAPGDSGDSGEAARKGEVADLIAHGKDALSPAVSAPTVSIALPPPQTAQRSLTDSRYQQWAEQKYLRALESPQVVTAFHNATLELPRSGNNDPHAPVADPSIQGGAQVRPAPSPYMITAGNVIPALLVSGLDSDLPGTILAQVGENVFDTATGRYLLVPQGSKLVGTYQSASVYGQERVQISWERLIFPNASSIELAGMPGADQSGYAGFTDQIDHHYLQTFGTALLMSSISAGQMVGQLTAFGSSTYSPYGYAPPSQWALAGEAAGAGASGQLGQVGQQSLQQGMNRPPSLKIRAGYEFNVMVTRDLVLAGPYKG